MKLVIASGNRGKIAEIKSILYPYFEEIVSMKEIGVISEPEETGETFAENALIKARALAALTGQTVLADDSGLCVDCLGGQPGVRSARYAGEQHDDEDNRQKLIRECARFPAPRTARFVCAAALVYPDGTEVVTQGEAAGEIILTPLGCDGFGYDPLFYYSPFGKTFAQLAFDTKNSVSHRRAALMALKEHFDG